VRLHVGRGEAAASAAAAHRITAPTDGTVLALDPDIPPQHQRVELTASTADARWQVDGRPLGRGARLPWFPLPGRHQIALVDARGALLDSIMLEVRGAGLPARR
jgi:Penicillin-Binding Protein C-terminus Family.